MTLYLIIGVIIYSIIVVLTQLNTHNVLPSNSFLNKFKEWFNEDQDTSYIVLFSICMLWPLPLCIFLVLFATKFIIKCTEKIIKLIRY